MYFQITQNASEPGAPPSAAETALEITALAYRLVAVTISSAILASS